MSHIDLHCHPSLKNIITKDSLLGPPIEFNTHVRLIFKCSDESEALGDILDSQCCPEQLKQGDFNVVFWSFVPFERQFIKATPVKKAIKNIKPPLEPNTLLLNQFRDAKKSYFELLSDEWHLMEEFVNNNKDSYQIIQSFDDIDEDKTNIFLNIESCHAFFIGKEENELDPEMPDDGFVERVDHFFKENPIAYLTLTHLAYNGVFTHCHATKLLRQSELLKSTWLPKRFNNIGWTKNGEEVINLCIKHNVAIDIKHLSYIGRNSLYYKINQTKGSRPIVIASHIGLTGCSMKSALLDFLWEDENDDGVHMSQKQVVYDNQRYVKTNYYCTSGVYNTLNFNPISINLYDEDILSIIKLGGLIGISLDKRILGKVSAPNEFLTVEDVHDICSMWNIKLQDLAIFDISKIDFNTGLKGRKHFASQYRRRGPKRRFKMPSRTIMIKILKDADSLVEGNYFSYNHSKGNIDSPRKIYKSIARFTQSIIYILDLAKANGLTAHDHICLGSDFDGLASTIKGCKTSADIVAFKYVVTQQLRRTKIRFKSTFNISIEELVTAVFEKNVRNFF